MSNAVLQGLNTAKEVIQKRAIRANDDADAAHARHDYASEQYSRGQAAGIFDCIEDINELIEKERKAKS